MDALISVVRENLSLDDSVLTFLDGLAAQMEKVAGDKAASIELADTVRAKSARIAEALAANTPPPAEPPAEEPPAEPPAEPTP